MAPFLSPATRAALDVLSSGERSEPEPEPLERLRAMRALLAALDADDAQLASVRSALEAGRSWDDIAEAAGLGRAAAKFRWQGTDADIEHRRQAGRKRSARPSSVPADLPGLSVAEEAARQGVTAQAIYQQVTRGVLTSEMVELPDGRRYKRVFPAELSRVKSADKGDAESTPGASSTVPTVPTGDDR
ncbi:hypothetical protein [Planctomonas psychrotolerans]|uniref:hypothetical protein n=1 Tax=Planctomonas psychrotolerans TaxID=2528712 RepID=UPI00123C156E|nr:hypothetical protein [Planctomonas psychrotolerans]